MSWLLVFLGGGVGSALRFGIGRWAVTAGREAIWATLLVNVVACALLGWLAADSHRVALSSPTRLLLAAGFCGGLSTFSTFSLEAVALVQEGRVAYAVLYVGLSLVLGFGALAWVASRA